tara:strand:+ start:49 stop:234 length:186 start_codon:yes stop_codon:yes gene_type:complete
MAKALNPLLFILLFIWDCFYWGQENSVLIVDYLIIDEYKIDNKMAEPIYGKVLLLAYENIF